MKKEDEDALANAAALAAGGIHRKPYASPVLKELGASVPLAEWGKLLIDAWTVNAESGEVPAQTLIDSTLAFIDEVLRKERGGNP